MVRDFAAAEILPHVMEWDEAQHFPLPTVKALGDLGLLGAVFPEQYGGAALSYIASISARASRTPTKAEPCSRCCPARPNNLPPLRGGVSQQKERNGGVR